MAVKGVKFPRPVFEKSATIKLPYGNKSRLKEGECNYDRCPAPPCFLVIAGGIAPGRVDDGTAIIYIFAADLTTLTEELSPSLSSLYRFCPMRT
jgi:hypothetical protein